MFPLEHHYVSITSRQPYMTWPYVQPVNSRPAASSCTLSPGHPERTNKTHHMSLKGLEHLVSPQWEFYPISLDAQKPEESIILNHNNSPFAELFSQGFHESQSVSLPVHNSPLRKSLQFPLTPPGNGGSERPGDPPSLLSLVKGSFITTLRLQSKSALSAGSVSRKHKSPRKKLEGSTKLRKVVNTLQHELTDQLLHFYCWKWILFFCRIFKSSWGYQV